MNCLFCTDGIITCTRVMDLRSIYMQCSACGYSEFVLPRPEVESQAEAFIKALEEIEEELRKRKKGK